MNEDGCGGAGRMRAGSSDRILKDKLGMKKRDDSGSKKRGNRDGRTTSRTPAQRRARKHLGQFAHMWRELTEEQRTAWRRAATEMDRLVRNGQYYRLNGQQLFNKLNSVRALCGQEPLTDPPALPNFGPNPVEALRITGSGDRIALKLSLCGSPAEDIMVFASPPYSAGRQYCSDYRFIGLLPDAVEHLSDITRLYVKKFGVPPANTRIFIRAWQQVDGWERRGQMTLTEALVPARPAAERTGKRARDKR